MDIDAQHTLRITSIIALTDESSVVKAESYNHKDLTELEFTAPSRRHRIGDIVTVGILFDE